MSQFFQDSMKMIKPRAASLKSAVMKSQLDDVFTMAETAMNEYSRKLENIRSDNRLTPEGKLAERKKIADSTRVRLDELKKPIEGYEREADQLQAAKAAPEKNEVLEYLKQREIRDRMGDDPILEQRYSMAVESGQNLELAEALEASPVPYEFVTDETRQQTALHKLPPESKDRVKEINSFKSLVGATVDAGHTAINQ